MEKWTHRSLEPKKLVLKQCMGCLIFLHCGRFDYKLPADFEAIGVKSQKCGRLAQLVEQLTLNQRVTGSSPVSPIRYLTGVRGGRRVFFGRNSAS